MKEASHYEKMTVLKGAQGCGGRSMRGTWGRLGMTDDDNESFHDLMLVCTDPIH
jgi:hypothetical protein